MERLTTDNPTDNIEASLNLFYVRDGDAFIRGGGDAPDYADISVTDFIRKAARTLCPDMLLPESAEEISFAMAEYLFDGYEEPSGLIALLYTAAWSYAELRERLKAYEDSGLSPKDAANLHAILRLGDGMTLMRLRELAVADQEGRVIVLPCKVGGTVYAIVQVFGDDGVRPRIIEKKITGIGGNALNKVWMVNKGNKYEDRFSPSEFGRTVFLTREEAEKALAEMEGK